MFQKLFIALKGQRLRNIQQMGRVVTVIHASESVYLTSDTETCSTVKKNLDEKERIQQEQNRKDSCQWW